MDNLCTECPDGGRTPARAAQKASKPPLMGNVTDLEEMFKLGQQGFFANEEQCLEVRRTEAGVLALPSKRRVCPSECLFRVSVLTKRPCHLSPG